MAAISVLIADDHALLRDILVQYLSAGQEFQVSAAGTLPEALDLIAAEGGFDVILLDIVMPGMDGLAGVAQVVAANPDGAVVVMSGNVQRRFIEQAMEGGVRGFVPKTLAPQALAEALRDIAEGGVYLPDDFDTTHQMPARSVSLLSPQETRVLRYLCVGLSNKEIAREMVLTEITIKTHMRAICTKLNAKNRTQAALIGAAQLND